MTVTNFVGLAEGSIDNDACDPGRPFFDGSTFHRVAPGHVIQGGSANSDRSGSPGYTIPNEIHPDLGHGHAGIVGMANGGPHTGASQFYITLGDRSYLDGDYTVFGEVVDGMDVVMMTVAGDTIQTVRIVRRGSRARHFPASTEAFHALRAEVAERVGLDDAERLQSEMAYVESAWPDAVMMEEGAWRFQVGQEGSGSLPSAGDRLRLRYSGETLDGLRFQSVDDAGRPGFILPDSDFISSDSVEGAVFEFEVGHSHVTPAFDAAAALMKTGERRTVVASYEAGYGPTGYYSPSVPGEPRFVISPNTMLIYSIERLED